MDNTPPNYINGDEYSQSAVLFTFIKKNNNYYLVLEQRSANISQAGEVCFPGGRFDKDKDKTTKDTAIRETCEELGVKKEEITNVNYWGTYIAPMSTLIDVYIGYLQIEDINILDINKDEVERLIVLPYSFFINNPPSSYEIDSWSYPYRKSKEDKDKILSIFPAKDFGLPPKYHKPWRGKSRQVHLYPNDDAPIWGVTANIIREFIKEYPLANQIFSEVK